MSLHFLTYESRDCAFLRVIMRLVMMDGWMEGRKERSLVQFLAQKLYI